MINKYAGFVIFLLILHLGIGFLANYNPYSDSVFNPSDLVGETNNWQEQVDKFTEEDNLESGGFTDYIVKLVGNAYSWGKLIIEVVKDAFNPLSITVDTSDNILEIGSYLIIIFRVFLTIALAISTYAFFKNKTG